MTTSEETAEYDRFGPWVDEVREPVDVPRLFRSYPVDLDATRLVLKVPRGIARRDATPGMDLYDHLLVLDDEQLTVLSRVEAGEGAFDVTTLPLARLVAVRDVVNLLDASLSVHTSDGEQVLVRYNGSARANIGRLVGELRQAVGHTGSSLPVPPVAQALRRAGSERAASGASLDPGSADSALTADFATLRQQVPSIVPWTFHGRVTVTPGGPSGPSGLGALVQRVLHTFSPMTLHGCVLAADDVALEVLGRHEWLIRGKNPVYSSSRLMVAWHALDGLTLAPHPTYPAAAVATLTAGRYAGELVVPVESPAHALLTEAATAATPA